MEILKLILDILTILFGSIGLIIAIICYLARPPSKNFYEIYWDDKDV